MFFQRGTYTLPYNAKMAAIASFPSTVAPVRKEILQEVFYVLVLTPSSQFLFYETDVFLLFQVSCIEPIWHLICNQGCCFSNDLAYFVLV